MQWLYTHKATHFLDIKQLGHPSNNFKTSSGGVQVLSIQQRQTNAPYMVPGATFRFFYHAVADHFEERGLSHRTYKLAIDLSINLLIA